MGLMLSAFIVALIALSSIPQGADITEEGGCLELVISVPDPVISIRNGEMLPIVDGWNTVGATGMPMLPERTFEIPLGAFHAEFLSAESAGPWTDRYVGAIALGKGASNGIVTVRNVDRDSPLAEDLGSIRTRSGNYLSIRISPYVYRNGMLTYPSEVRVSLDLDADLTVASVNVPAELPYAYEAGSKTIPIWEPLAVSVGDPGASPSYSNTIPPTEMVIVTTSTYNSTLQDLAKWKTQKGIFTRVVEVSWITGKYTGADTPDKIRKYLIDLYTKESLKWVLLAGDHDTVPSRMAYIPDGYDDSGSDGSTVPADSYYGDLAGSGATPYDWDGDNDGNYGEYSVDGIDLTAEAYVGRLSPTSATMATLVRNIIDYEKSPPSGGWTNRSVVAGAYSNYKTSTSSNDTTDEADLKEAIRKDFVNNGKYNVYTLYEKAGIWPSQQPSNASLNTANMASAISPGAFMVNMAGHGSSTGIYRRIWNSDTDGDKICDTGPETTDTSYYSTSSSPTNGAKRPLFYNDACNNGEFDRTTSLTEDILNDVGIGSIGSARVSWYEVHWSKGSNGGYYNQGHDYRFWQQFFNGGNHQPGRSLALSKPDYISDVGGYMDLFAWKNLLQYNLMGDPEIPIWTQSPKTLTVTYPNPIQSPGQVSITVKDPSNNAVAGARVCLMNGTIFYGVATTDATGVAKITLPSITKSMNLTVTKNDFKVWTKAVLVGLDNVLPTISSVSFLGSDTTGDAFQVRGSAADTGGISMVCLHHAYSSSQPATYNNSTMTFASGYYSYSNDHPIGSALPFWYRFCAWDTAGNRNMTAWTGVPIWDNDPPAFGSDTTQAGATTGDPFVFSISASDNIGTASVRVNYTLDTGVTFQNVSLSGTGTYSVQVLLPDDRVGTMGYRFLAYDAAGNVKEGTPATRIVSDNDDPYFLVDLTTGRPTTGDSYTLAVRPGDNIGIAYVKVKYKIGNDAERNVTMDRVGLNYTYAISIPNGEYGLVDYRFMVEDPSGNVKWSDPDSVMILDDELPGSFEDMTSDGPTTGDGMVLRFAASDNIAIENASAEFDLGKGAQILEAVFNGTSGYFETWISVDASFSGNLTYRYWATDTTGNTNLSSWFSTPVTDNDPPVLVEDRTVHLGTTGDEFSFLFVLYDNIGIENAIVEWTLGSEEGEIDSIGDDMSFISTFELPSSDGILNYVFVVTDPSGNEMRTDPGVVVINDNDRPLIVSETRSNATTGDPFTVSAEVTDNVGIGSVFLLVTFTENLTMQHMEMERIGGIWSAEFVIPSNCTGSISYSIGAMDRSDNVVMGNQSTVEVVDNDDPFLSSASSIGALKLTTGDDFEVEVEATDNVGIVEYNLTLISGVKVMTVIVEGSSGPVRIPFTTWTEVVGDVEIILTAKDHSNNGASRSFEVTISDNDEPAVSFVGLSQEIGQSLGCVFEVEAFDNIGVDEMTVRTTPGGLIVPNDGKYEFSPDEAGGYVIEAVARDHSGNEKRIQVTVQVDDDIEPTAPIEAEGDAKIGGTYSLTAPGEEGVAYEWEITTPSGKTIRMTGSKVDLSIGESGEYRVKLKATDGAGNEAISETKLTVPPEGSEGLPWIPIAGIVILLLVMSALMAFFIMRRKKENGEWEAE